MNPVPPIIPRCRHIKANGLQCGSPALSRAHFCYFHQRWRETRPNGRRVAAASPLLDLPLLEDANAIQVALQQVIAAIVNNQIDNKKAGLLLFALQTASSNLKRTCFEPQSKLLLHQELEEPDPALEPATAEAPPEAAPPSELTEAELDARLISQIQRLSGIVPRSRRTATASAG